MDTASFSKKNLRKIPSHVSTKIDRLSGNEVVVACARTLSAEEINGGRYAHLDIRMEEGEPLHPDSIVPPSDVGRYSAKNAERYIKKLTDQPKETHYNEVEAPNYGDPSKGYHTVELPYKKYTTQEMAPTLIPLEIEWLAAEALHPDTFVFRFTIREELDPTEEDFEAKLLRNLNLLQENVGKVDVFPPGAPQRDYLDHIYVDWEILPPGEGQSRDRVLPNVRGSSVKERREIAERYTFLEELGPTCIVEGQNYFERYFGTMFGEEVVVFENLTYGNAVYVMNEKWKDLSKKSRTELIEEDPESVTRIVHRDGWKRRVKQEVRKRLNGASDE